MNHATGFRCINCLREYGSDHDGYTCPKCGGNLDILYDYDAVGRELTKEMLLAEKRPDIWRYAPLLPVSDLFSAPPLSVGGSPMYHSKNLGRLLGLDYLYI